MTCQAVKGKIRWSQRLKLRMRAIKGPCLLEMEGGDILCECMICSGPDVPLDRPLEWRAVLPAVFLPSVHAAICWWSVETEGKSTELLCTTIPPLQLLSKTNSPVKLQFNQQCFCLPRHRFSMHRSNQKELLLYLYSRWSLLRLPFPKYNAW